MNRSDFSAAALLFARRLWRKGKWHPETKSPFLLREEKADKVTVWLRFDAEVYLLLRKMAQALCVSLAEMLRLALDVYCSYLLRDGPGIVRKVVSRRPRKAVRIRGGNVLDNLDHDVYWLGGVLDFSICDVRDVSKEGDGPERFAHI